VDPHHVRRQWAERSGEYSPAYYAYRGPDGTSESLRETVERYVAREAPVLEVGCSAGRHLAHLHRHGFEDLTGVDVNADALEVMAEAYPALAEAGTFHVAAIEDAAAGFADDRFAATYSVETLQHLHPDADGTLAELARVTGSLLVTVENEGNAGTDRSGTSVTYVDDDLPLYHRNWAEVFTDLGFVQVDVSVGERDTMRTFLSEGEWEREREREREREPARE
jgi:SAM-dependent methyltransferase